MTLHLKHSEVDPLKYGSGPYLYTTQLQSRLDGRTLLSLTRTEVDRLEQREQGPREVQ
jgi:hypothetical protein